MIYMGLSTKITGYDRFMDKFNRKKKQTANSQPKSRFSNNPVAQTPKNSSVK
jgi:hypothetical protein